MTPSKSSEHERHRSREGGFPEKGSARSRKIVAYFRRSLLFLSHRFVLAGLLVVLVIAYLAAEFDQRINEVRERNLLNIDNGLISAQSEIASRIEAYQFLLHRIALNLSNDQPSIRDLESEALIPRPDVGGFWYVDQERGVDLSFGLPRESLTAFSAEIAKLDEGRLSFLPLIAPPGSDLSLLPIVDMRGDANRLKFTVLFVKPDAFTRPTSILDKDVFGLGMLDRQGRHLIDISGGVAVPPRRRTPEISALVQEFARLNTPGATLTLPDGAPLIVRKILDSPLYLVAVGRDQVPIGSVIGFDLLPELAPVVLLLLIAVLMISRSERAIRDREQYLKAILDSSVDGMVTIDDQGIIRTVNAATLSIFGYEREELVGFNVKILMPESYFSNHDQYLRNYFETGIRKIIGIGQEVTGRKKSGVEFPLELAVTEFRSSGGERQFLGTLSDLTERKTAESAQMRFGRIMGSISNEIYVINAETLNFRIINNSAARNLGIDRQEMDAWRLIDILPSFTFESLFQFLSPLLSGSESSLQLKTVAKRRDGSQYDIEGVIQYLEAEVPPIFVLTAADVTEHNERSRRLSESEEGLRYIVDELRDHSILTLAPDGIVKAASIGTTTVFGYLPEEIVGRSVSILSCADDLKQNEPWRMLNEASLKGRDLSDARRLRKDGTEIWVDTSLTAIKDKLGQTSGFIQISRDITEHRQRESKLQQSQKMEAIGQLTGGIAHDFNNLLSVVIGNLALLEERLEDEELLEMLDSPLRAARRGAQLTQHLLAFARRQTLKPEILDLKKTIAKTVQLLTRVLSGNIVLEFNISDPGCLVIADEAQLESAILNLALNARDAMPDGGALTITARSVDVEATTANIRGDISPGPYVEISVVDTGIGMPQSIVERIFEPFFTTKVQGKGTGLGLSMVYGFAQQSRGGIGISSEVGKGTSVQLYLPRAASLPMAAQRERAQGVGRILDLHVLLVEDDGLVRLSVKRQLETLGCQVIEADSGVAGLKVLRENSSFDLLVSDIVMPGGTNGLELAKICRKEWPDLEIVLMTGYADPAELRDAGGETPFRIMSKPFDRDELSATLRKIFPTG